MGQTDKQLIQKLLNHADIRINGNRPQDIKINNNKFYKKVLLKGSLGLGESYIDGWWDCKKLDMFFEKILKAELEKKILSFKTIYLFLKALILNLQTKTRSNIVGKIHYDIGNNLYKNMLDKRMIYSCGYWENSKNLNQSQEAKLDLICKKLNLKPGQKILDIGCGWGGFAKYATEKYKVQVVGITISKEQAKFAKKACKGLPIEIRLQDYREVKEKFDHIISIGMMEHVGYKNYKTYMKVVSRNLKDNGLFLLHTIGKDTSSTYTDPWIEKYIFPNSMIPSVKQITTATEGIFILEDWHNFGIDYDKTLMQWHKNFVKNWNKLKNSYDKKFYRMWTYYLLSCAGSFRSRKNQLWQIVFSKKGVIGGYKSIR